MTDSEFLDAFESGAIPPGDFHHQDHLRLTWLLLRRDGLAAGSDRVAGGIRHYAQGHGQGPRYHETMTRFWTWIVGHAIAAEPAVDSFPAFKAAFPLLLDKSLPFRHWSREAIFTSQARAEWVEPDLQRLPSS